MKFFQKYRLYENKLIQPYLNGLVQTLAVITGLASLLYILSLVYQYGFIISSSESKVISRISTIVWIIFLTDITIHFLLGNKFKEQRYRKLTVAMSIMLYLTLFPVMITLSGNNPVFLFVWNLLESMAYKTVLLSLFSLVYLSNSIIRMLGKRTNPSLILAISFFLIIIIGSGLLMLPRCTYQGIDWVDSLFISTSAVCVTGLTSVDPAATFTPVGFGIIIILIQIGGLGVMTLTSFFAMFFMGDTSLYNQLVVRDLISSQSLGGLLSTLLNILVFTLIIEGAGAVVIWSDIHGTLYMTLSEEVAFCVFHSISGFCNAGFSTLPANLGNELLMSGHNWFYIYISFLIIFGGIGFPILVNIKEILHHQLDRILYFFRTRKWGDDFLYHQLSLNTRIVFVTTLILLVAGTAIILIFEWNNSFAGMPVADKIIHAFFNSASTRTAGFSSVELTRFSVQSILFYMLLMWIGGGAQSTAGGIKVNAFAVIVVNLRSILRGASKVEALGRELPVNSIRRANATAMVSLATIFVFALILTILEPDRSLLSLFFECFSAIGTVGSSLNTSMYLGKISKLLISLLMFLGRVGIITLILGIIKQKKNTKYKYPEEDIIIN